MYAHQDVFKKLNTRLSLKEKLEHIHAHISQQFPYITRIAAALYEVNTNSIKTFIHSTNGDSPLNQYEVNLDEAASLKDMVEKGVPRVVNDLQLFKNGNKAHTQAINNHGYSASYTFPMYIEDGFFGFLFYNSEQTNCFSEQSLPTLDLFSHLINLTIANDLGKMKTLIAAVETAKGIANFRDDETGNHLNRMAHYAQMIARIIADKHQLSDEFIENLFLYAPLHDIGKIATPDKILFKPAKLTIKEFEVMKQHTLIGAEIINDILDNFGSAELSSVEILKNIALLHHETLNGSGYPYGLKKEKIPIEARIIAVADIFDALTSRRPYKDAWSNAEAISMLKSLVGVKQLDPDCVLALANNINEVKKIQQLFYDKNYD